jgi:hypothetical protein
MKRRVVPRDKVLIMPAGVDRNKIDLIKRLRTNIAKHGYAVGFVGSIFCGRWWIAWLRRLLKCPGKLISR